MCQVALFLTTVFLHRTLSHRAITMSPGLRFTCRLLTWIMTGIKPRQWVAVHRRHHAFTDVEGDPHSPLLEGFATVQIGNVVLYRRAARDGSHGQQVRQGPPGRPMGPGPVRPRLRRARGRASASCCWSSGATGSWPPSPPRTHVVTYLLLNSAVNAVGHTLRPTALRGPGRQHPVAGLADRRRGSAQQPPRRPHLGPAVLPPGRDRPGLVDDRLGPEAALAEGSPRAASRDPGARPRAPQPV